MSKPLHLGLGFNQGALPTCPPLPRLCPQITFFLWGSLILTPDSAAVKKLFRGYTVIVVAALAYAWLAYLCFEDPVAMQGFSSMSDLGGLTKGFASQTAVATVWAHLIAGDLFVGR